MMKATIFNQIPNFPHDKSNRVTFGIENGYSTSMTFDCWKESELAYTQRTVHILQTSLAKAIETASRNGNIEFEISLLTDSFYPEEQANDIVKVTLRESDESILLYLGESEEFVFFKGAILDAVQSL
jgi:hypothetical protein